MRLTRFGGGGNPDRDTNHSKELDFGFVPRDSAREQQVRTEEASVLLKLLSIFYRSKWTGIHYVHGATCLAGGQILSHST